MTIKEVEERTGLARSHIRFYEKEELICPTRNEKNRYREYSGKDVENLKKIAYLRTLGISLEDIRKIMKKEICLHEVIEKQTEILEQQISEMEQARRMCRSMMAYPELDFENLDIAQFAADLPEYWRKNGKRLRIDTLSLAERIAHRKTWMALTAFSLLLAAVFFFVLPQQIPVQWSKGAAVSFRDKSFLFVYPAACIGARLALRAAIRARLWAKGFGSVTAADYAANAVCCLFVSAEIVTALFCYGKIRHVEVILIAEILILLGILTAGWNRMQKKAQGQ